MSGSETGVMASREPFSVGLQKSPVSSQPVIQNMRLAFSADGTAVYKPINNSSPSYQPNSAGAASAPAGGGEGGSAGGPTVSPGFNMNMGSEPMKRKRGRPRKYGPDSTMGLALISAPHSVPVGQSIGGGGFCSPPPATASAPSSGGPTSPTSKKARGRPPGSSKKQQLEAMGPAGFGFIPHIITVKAGEDVSSKIMSFSQHGPRAVCILSATGAVSNVTLRQAATSGGTVTYEGRFEILSLSGSFLLSENGGQRSRTGGLSVSLSGPDGRVLGGGVAGLLTAATPIQIVVGSFIADGRKGSMSPNQLEPSSAPPQVSQGGGTGPSSPPSRGTLSESSGGPGSPLNQSTGACTNNNPQPLTAMPWK